MTPMTPKLVGVATLFAAGSILLAGTPTLGTRTVDRQSSAASALRCGGRRCGGGGHRCGHSCAHYCGYLIKS